MPRKRKIPVDKDKENENEHSSGLQKSHSTSSTSTVPLHHGPMYSIFSHVQLNETFHKKYVKEMKQLRAKMDHDAFMFTFIKMVKSAMEVDENNEYANTTLLFCAKFVTSYDGDDTHPVLSDIFKWLLTTISHSPHIRYRLCQFVNLILNALGAEAALDDCICDGIMNYMLQRLRDINPSVRVQAILALQRLQFPDNPDDPVVRVYQFHLCSDPSPRVRQAVITSMGRNFNTIPYILDRLWDNDEKVRRHTYLHMSSYPVKAYKVAQRLTLLEQGLNDRSEMVKKVVTTILLEQWLESYQKNYIMLVAGLKLDATELEMDRFRKIAKVTLKEIFMRQKKADLVACLPLEEDEGEYYKCVPHDKLTVETALYWQCLTEFLQVEGADELDLILPELSTFCSFVEKFCHSQKENMNKFEKMAFQYILLSLMEIAYTFDLGDEIGRENLKKLLTTILKTIDLEETIIEIIVKCAENLLPEQDTRLQFFVDNIQEICDLNCNKNDLVHDRNLISELMEKSSDKDLNLKLSSLKVKILDLEEQEMNFVEMKDYTQAQKITDEKNACTEEYSNLLKPLLEKHSKSDHNISLQQSKKVTTETIMKCLQVAFYMIVSRKVKSLTPNVCKLYNEFIRRHIASYQIPIRDWALKCGTAYSMRYEALAKDVFDELYSQFYKNHNIRIWKTTIACIFELLDRYGVTSLVGQDQSSKSKKPGRQLYNTLEFLDVDDDASTTSSGQGVDVLFMMSHFLDTCDDNCIVSAIISGFCRLVLHGHINNSEVIEKLLLRYFNPTTDAEINQILGVFFENMIQRKKQEYLQPCILPTITTILSAPYDSPLHEIKPDTVVRFVIDATRPECCAPGVSIHNKIAQMFLQEIHNNIVNKDLCKVLAKGLLMLQLSVDKDPALKAELKSSAEKLIKCELDLRTIKNIIDFKDILDGIFNPPLKVIEDAENGSDEEYKSDNETMTSAEPGKDLSQPEPSEILLNVEPQTANSTVASAHEKTLNQTPQSNRSPDMPTTFGRDNRIGLRHLRKSLNNTRSNSVSEEGEPLQPPKIRIEARIDSDIRPIEGNSRNVRTKRNLRNAVTESAKESNEKMSSAGQKTTKNIQQDSEDEEISSKKKSSKRKSDIPTKPQNDPESEELNLSEVIPPSPIKKTTRTRQIGHRAITKSTSQVESGAVDKETTVIEEATKSPSGRKRPRTPIDSTDLVNRTPHNKAIQPVVVTSSLRRKITSTRVAVRVEKNVVLASGGRVTTRNAFKKEMQNKIIMTRKRLSMDVNQLLDSCSHSTLSAGIQETAHKKTTIFSPRASKIPVLQKNTSKGHGIALADSLPNPAHRPVTRKNLTQTISDNSKKALPTGKTRSQPPPRTTRHATNNTGEKTSSATSSKSVKAKNNHIASNRLLRKRNL